jgi:hypothetical protein
MWKWKCPLKTRLFLWLALANRILTWDNGQRRGWSGPNKCTLCKVEEESVSHLFVSCSFASQVWREVMMNLNCPGQWIFYSLELCLWNWLRNPFLKQFKELPCYVIWGIWLHRNQVLFYGHYLKLLEAGSRLWFKHMG